MTKITSALILVGILAGCASQMEMNMESSAQEKYNKDSFECEKNTQESGFYGGLIDVQDMKINFKKCMISKGWTLQNNQ